MTDEQEPVTNADLAAKVDRMAYLVLFLVVVELIRLSTLVLPFASTILYVGLLLGGVGFLWLFVRAVVRST